MVLPKCCVVDCNATSETHRLFNIPRDDILRALWLSFLIPVSPSLRGLSKEQLIYKRVCQKHFDRYQFDQMGNRLSHAYPSLFSTKEIFYGIPLNNFGGNLLTDHNYCLLSINDDDTAVTTVTGEGDHTYSVASTSFATTSTNIPECPFSKQSHIEQSMEVDLIVNQTQNTSTSSHSRKVAVHIESSTEHLTVEKQVRQKKKCTSFIKDMKKLSNVESKKVKTFNERFESAKNLSQNPTFIKNIHKLSKPAQSFLLMQLKLAEKKKKAYRFTINEKLVSLTLMKESPKGYRLLQKIFTLPSKRTLNRVAEKVTFHPGINGNIFLLLKQKAMKWETKKKLCSIVFDEVALTPHLTFDEHQDKVKGFKDLGYKRDSKFCDHALVFMVRGVCANWRQPICYYFCEGTISSAELVKILKEISQTSLIPIAFVCDQGSTFRTAINILRKETERNRFLADKHNDGSIEISGQQLSIIFDPPHLLKGIRNNFVSKNMIFEGKVASWDDILTIYNTDFQLGHTKMNRKLTDQHVIPNKIRKMKVSVAAQVLNQQTSAMLKYTSLFDKLKTGKGVSKTMGATGEAVEFFDKLFDSVNGSRKGSIRGKLRGAVKLKSEHFKFWTEARKKLKNIKFIDCNSKRAMASKKEYHVRVPSLDSWIVTLESFERISKLLFNKYGVQYFYPRNINQDPLENFFGQIRALNYRNVNPDAYTFINSFKSLLISNIMGPHSIYSNCEEDDGETIVNFFNLLKIESHEDKENIDPLCSTSNKDISDFNKEPQPSISNEDCGISLEKVIIEKMKVHSSAYTAGYIVRKLNRKFNCKNCQKIFTAPEKENYHAWIAQREYKSLKHSNLVYSSKEFLILYRNISDLIHNFMNSHGHQRKISSQLKKLILKNIDLQWLGCDIHKENVVDFFIKIILRVQVHNWCNNINRILRGSLDEKHVNNIKIYQKALLKYRTNKLKKRNLINS